MNYLEEIALAPNMRQQDIELINSKVSALRGNLESLKGSIRPVSMEFEKNYLREQGTIVEDIYEFNKKFIKPNEKILHENIHKESELRAKIEAIRKDSQIKVATTPEELLKLKKDLRDHLEKIIEELEQVNFPEIAKIRKLKDQTKLSFDKVWIFVLEVVFNLPSSKYYWKEFSEKTMVKDQGKELRRRLIITKWGKLSAFEKAELFELVHVHSKLLVDNISNVEFKKFLDFLKITHEYVLLYDSYTLSKGVINESLDLKKMKEEKERILLASQKLNNIKYDLVSEMQNLLLLVDFEFR